MLSLYGWISCNGVDACWYGDDINSSLTRIESNYAEYKGTITADKDIFCDASYTCSYSIIQSSEGQVLSSGYYGIYYGDITAQSVWVYGHRSASYSNI